MNPTDAYRKQARKREIKRNKAERHYIREAFSRKTQASELKAELEQLIAIEQTEELTKLQKLRKKVVQEAYENAIRKQKVCVLLLAVPMRCGFITYMHEGQASASAFSLPKCDGMCIQAFCKLCPALCCAKHSDRLRHLCCTPMGHVRVATEHAYANCKHGAPYTSLQRHATAMHLQEEEFRKRQAEEEGKQLHAGLSSVPLPKPPPLPAGPKPGLPPPPAAPPLPAGPAPGGAAAAAGGNAGGWGVVNMPQRRALAKSAYQASHAVGTTAACISEHVR